MVNFLFALLLFSLGSGVQAACSCERVSHELAFAQNPHVFGAKVIRIEGSKVSLEEVKVFKGTFLPQLEILPSPCRIDLASGKSYVFFLKDAKLRSACEPHIEMKEESAVYQGFVEKMRKGP